MKQLFIPFILLVLFYKNVYAQESIEHPVVRCTGTEEITEERMQFDPAYRSYVLHIRKQLNQWMDDNRNPDCSGGTIKIPVAAHFDSGIVPAGQEACAVSVVQSQIASLNTEFTGNDPQNAAFANFTSCFGNIIGDACIEFCLAVSGHPSGYGLTDGEAAVTFGQVNFAEVFDGDGLYIPSDPNWAGYLNLFIADIPSGGPIGQSYTPGNFSGEGAVIDACYFGSGSVTCPGMSSSGASGCNASYDEGNTVTHEVGHYFSLPHTWGPNPPSCATDDGFADTPDADEDYLGYFESTCNTHTSCADLPSTCSSEDMYMNYMSYVADGCMYMFTSDQADAMYNVATTNGFTSATPAVCLPPVAPVADFTYSSTTVCPSECIQFTDASTNLPISWSWSFSVTSGDITLDITSSTAQNPEVCITGGSSGNIQATLTATNGAGSDPETKTFSVSVLGANDPSCEIACTQYAAGPYTDLISGSACFQSCPLISPGYQVWENEAYYLLSLDANVNYTLEFCNGYSAATWEAVITIASVSFPLGAPVVGSVLAKTSGCTLTFTPTVAGDYIAIISGKDNCGGAYNQTSNGFITFTCSSGSCTHCGNQFTDDGGTTFTYSNNQNTTYTICPDDAGDLLTVSFQNIDMEGSVGSCTDQLEVYNGVSVSGSPVATLCGTSVGALPNSGVFNGTAAGECLTFRFISNGSTNGGGWLANTSCALILPVEFLNFEATTEASSIQLDWQTVSEINNEGFYITRRIEGAREFEILNFIPGAGNSKTIQTYSYLDKAVFPGINYHYRLLQVDYDGQEEYSNVIAASLSTTNGFSFNIHPNPATNQLNIYYHQVKEVEAILYCYNSIGQPFGQYELNNGQPKNLEVDNWPAGVYFFIVVIDGQERHMEKVVKER